MINVTELRPGNYFEDEGALYQVLDILLNKTAMRKMVAKIKVKNMRTGAIFELARNSGYGVEEVRLDKKTMQYLYDAGETLCFMNPSAQDFVEAFKNANADNIIVFPNNGNVILTAQQAAKLFTGSKITIMSPVLSLALLGRSMTGPSKMRSSKTPIRSMDPISVKV